MRRAFLLFLIAISVGFYAYRNVAVASRYVDASPSDFSHYHDAARSMAAGQSPYAVHNFDYPPLVAMIVRPLAGYSYEDARAIWFLLNHVALLAAAFVAWRALGRGLGAAAAVAAAWGLCGTAAENLVLGQIGPVILLLVALAGLIEPAGPLGVAAALKFFPGLALVREAFARRWVSFAAGLAVTAILIALPLRSIAALPGPAFPASAGYWMGTPALLNISLPAVAWRAVDPPRGKALPQNWVSGDNPKSLRPDPRGRFASVATSLIVLLAGAAAIAWRYRVTSCRTIEIGAWMALAILASPIAWYHYAVVLFPAIAAAGLELARSRRFPALAALVACAGVLTWSHVFGAGKYIATYGWTAKEPLLLYAASVLAAAAAAGVFTSLVWILGWETAEQA
ncbi:MAG: glycosyltransferase family 87 protein [Thermoanaerobaculia bacterium]